MLYTLQEGERVEEWRHQKNDLHNSIRDAYEGGEITLDKAREQFVAVHRMQDDKSMDEKFSIMIGQEKKIS